MLELGVTLFVNVHGCVITVYTVWTRSFTVPGGETILTAAVAADFNFLRTPWGCWSEDVSAKGYVGI